MKRLTAILLVLAVFVACAQVRAESKNLEGNPYPNSNLYGNWPDERPGPEESFELYVNFDAYRKALANGQKKPEYQGERVQAAVRDQILELCRDSGQPDTEAEILRILYGIFSNIDLHISIQITPIIQNFYTACEKDGQNEFVTGKPNGIQCGTEGKVADREKY